MTVNAFSSGDNFDAKLRIVVDRVDGSGTQTICSAHVAGKKNGAATCGSLVELWILRARDRDRDILARLRFGHQRPLNRRCPDEKYQYVNNNRLTEYPGTPAWTPATSKSRVSNERKKSYFFPFFHLFAK